MSLTPERNEQIAAVERLADKRHARLMGAGHCESVAAYYAARYLGAWLREWEKKRGGSIPYVRGLREGYLLRLDGKTREYRGVAL